MLDVYEIFKLHLFLQKLIAQLFHDEEELLNVVNAHQVASILDPDDFNVFLFFNIVIDRKNSLTAFVSSWHGLGILRNLKFVDFQYIDA